MSCNRRGFLKTLGVGSVTMGFAGAGLSSCGSRSYDKTKYSYEQVVEVSEKVAIVDIKLGIRMPKFNN